MKEKRAFGEGILLCQTLWEVCKFIKGDWEKPSFEKRVLGVWLTILDLVIFIHFGWAIFSLASWGFATFNLASERTNAVGSL